MKLRIAAALAALYGLAAVGQGQIIFSFEDGGLAGFSPEEGGGTLSVGTGTGVTHGNYCLHWAKPDFSWKRILSGNMTDQQVSDLINAPKKKLLIDTYLEFTGTWKEMLLVLNSASGGYSQSGGVGLAYNSTGKETIVFDYSSMGLPALTDGYRELGLIFQGGGGDPIDLYIDNIRVEESATVEDFEGGIDAFGTPPDGVTYTEVTHPVNGTKALRLDFALGAGFKWIGMGLSLEKRTLINSGTQRNLLIDVTVPTEFQTGWQQMEKFSLNDSLGWREITRGTGLPSFYAAGSPGWVTKTVVADLSLVAPYDLTSGWGQFFFSLNADSAFTHTYIIDNIRIEGASDPAGDLKGTVTLADWTGAVAGREVTMEIMQAGSIVRTDTVTLDGSGSFTNPMGSLAPGTYDIGLKASHWLRKVVTGVNVTASGASGIDATLTNGDVDNDNVVTVFDYNALSDAFDTSEGDANWNAEADLDGDGAVTVFDYNILSTNFDVSGD